MGVKVQFGLDQEIYDLLIQIVLEKCNKDKKLISCNEYAKNIIVDHIKKEDKK